MRLNKDNFFKNFNINYLLFINNYYNNISIVKIKKIIRSEIAILQKIDNVKQIKERNISYWIIRGWSYEDGMSKIIDINNKRKKNKNYGLLTIDYWISKGYTEFESKSKISEIQKERSYKSIITKKNDPNYKPPLSPFTKEFWIEKGFNDDKEIQFKINSQRKNNKYYWLNKGYTEDEAIEQVSIFQKENTQKYIDKRNTNKELYNDISSNQLGYWIKMGYTEEESKQKLSERQSTFSLKKCINKYGEEEGGKIFQKRQEKWMNSMSDKKINFNHDSSSMSFFKNKYGSDYLLHALDDLPYNYKKRNILKNVIEKNMNITEFCHYLLDISATVYDALILSNSIVLDNYFNITKKEMKEKIYDTFGAVKTKYGIMRFFNGHICRSDSEYQIANYLFKNKIEYEYEKGYPNSKYICDFYIKEKDLYIEYVGLLKINDLCDREMYINKYKMKQKFCDENNINYFFSDNIKKICDILKQ